MLHHVSFNARDPQRAARILASLLDATAVRLPAPPFPTGAWSVVCGDAQGSMLELIPWGNVLDADVRGGMLQDRQMRPRTGSHVLASTPLSADTVMALAAREGLRASPMDSGLFQFIKLWVEEALLVELLTPQQIAAYQSAFGASGVATLDARFRQIEQTLDGKLKSKRTGTAAD